MPFLQDATKFCLHCGTLLPEGQSRCPACGRRARASKYVWVVLLGAAGVASGWWARAKGASDIAMVVSALAAAALGAGGLHFSVGNPNSPHAGRRGSWRRTALGLLFMAEAVAIPAYWSVSSDRGTGVSTTPVAVISFVVLPALIVPMATVSIQLGLGGIRPVPTCDACGAYVGATARFCSACGRQR